MHAHRLVDLQGTIARNPASRVAVQSRRALVVHERHEREVQRVLIVGGAVDHALGHLGNGAALLLAVGVSEDRIIRVAQPAAHAEASVRRAWNELTSVLVHPRQGAGWRAGAHSSGGLPPSPFIKAVIRGGSAKLPVLAMPHRTPPKLVGELITAMKAKHVVYEVLRPGVPWWSSPSISSTTPPSRPTA